jgi:hypothetical protein
MRRLTRWLPHTLSSVLNLAKHPTQSWAAKPQILALEDRVVLSRPLQNPVLYVGAGANQAPMVRAYDADTGGLLFEKLAFESNFTGCVHLATADVTGDGVADLIVGAGPGGGPRIRVLDGTNGAQLPGPLGSFFAYTPTFTGGVEVAASDVNGDGYADIITGAGIGGGPHLQVFSGQDGSLITSFFAYSPDFTGGIHVAAADYTNDNHAEIIVSAGIGGGPHIRVINADTMASIPGPLGNFWGMEASFHRRGLCFGEYPCG